MTSADSSVTFQFMQRTFDGGYLAVGNLYIRSIPAARPLRLAYGQQVFSGLPTLVLVLALFPHWV